jgi:hypothetical protein
MPRYSAPRMAVPRKRYRRLTADVPIGDPKRCGSYLVAGHVNRSHALAMTAAASISASQTTSVLTRPWGVGPLKVARRTTLHDKPRRQAPDPRNSGELRMFWNGETRTIEHRWARPLSPYFCTWEWRHREPFAHTVEPKKCSPAAMPGAKPPTSPVGPLALARHD